MTENDIKQGVISAIKMVTGKKEMPLGDETLLFEELGLESIDFVDVVFEAEKILNREIDLSQVIISTQNSVGRYSKLTLREFSNLIWRQLEDRS